MTTPLRKQCDLEAHILGCSKCVALHDGGFWLCREGVSIEQELIENTYKTLRSEERIYR